MTKIIDMLFLKFDWYRKEIIFASIIFLVATVSFACGFLLSGASSHAPIIIEECASSTS